MPSTRRSWFQAGLSGWFSQFLPAKAKTRNIYDELGVRTVINFRGTHTTIGASCMWPELHPAMEQASRHFVSLDELQDKASERLSALIGCEAAMVTTGAAGAITAGTCACLAGTDSAKIKRLPDLTGMKTEVLVLKLHRNGYDHAVRNTGIRMIEVENEDQLRRAAGSQVAMMYYLGGTSGDHEWPETLSLEACLRVLKPMGIPILIDAANMLPPWDNIRKLAKSGVDLIAVSGGKHIRGPQCSGFLAGRKDLVTAARLNVSPHSDSLGRPLKIGREEIVGMMLAAEKYSKLDFDAVDRVCQRQAEFLKREIESIPGLKVGFSPFDRTRKIRRVWVTWDEAKLGMTAAECEKKLWDGDPRVAVLRHSPQGLVFTAFMNEDGDEKIAARRMKQVFAKA